MYQEVKRLQGFNKEQTREQFRKFLAKESPQRLAAFDQPPVTIAPSWTGGSVWTRGM